MKQLTKEEMINSERVLNDLGIWQKEVIARVMQNYAEQEKKKDNWISDKTQEPFGELELYLIYIDDKQVIEKAWCPDSKNGEWLLNGHFLAEDYYIPNENVTHWQVLPKRPK